MDAARSPDFVFEDATFWVICGEEPMVYIHCEVEDDACYLREEWDRGFEVPGLLALAQTLADGSDHAFEVVRGDRHYRTTFSFDHPGSDQVPADPAAQLLWFYPMTESRMIQRARARELVPGLTSSVEWLLRRRDCASATDSATFEQIAGLLGSAAARIGL